MRHIQQRGDLGETMRVAVLGQFVANVEMGQLQQRTQVVFKLHTSEAPHRTTTVFRCLFLCGGE